MRITERERDTYAEMWTHDQYAGHSPGEQVLPLFLDMAQIPASQQWPGSVLDAGCGSGKGTLALVERGFAVTACDLVDARVPEAIGVTVPFHQACLWQDLRPLTGFTDYVYCCDVLEHIPPEFTMLTITRLLQVARKGVFLHISLVPDGFGAYVGKALHQSVFPFTWWRDRLKELGDLVECRDLVSSGVYYMRPR